MNLLLFKNGKVVHWHNLVSHVEIVKVVFYLVRLLALDCAELVDVFE